MSSAHQPSGPRQALSVLIEAHWTPEQALAVWELLDDLRECIWLHYRTDIQTVLREQRSTISTGYVPNPDDPPF
jgi:hypothetical protein